MILAAYYTYEEPGLLDRFDILAVEQRGTAWTRPKLTCDETIAFKLSHVNSIEDTIEQSQLEELQKKCLSEFNRTHSIDSVSTYQIASDIHFTANLFGYNRFSFWGVSYGTLVGQYLLNYYPQDLERTILDSGVVPGRHWGIDAANRVETLIEKNVKSFIAEVQVDVVWGKTYDETLTYFNDLSEAFAQNPMQVEFNYKEKNYPVTIGGEEFNALLFKFILIKNGRNLHRLVGAAQRRNSNQESSKTVLTRLVNSFLDLEDSTTDIVYQALICREFSVQNRNVADHSPSFRKMFNENERKFSIFSDTCYLGFSPSPDPKVIRGPVSSTENVLVVGAELDHVTSPAYVNSIAQNFTNGKTVVFKDASHGVFDERECINKSLIDYLTNLEGLFTNFCE